MGLPFNLFLILIFTYIFSIAIFFLISYPLVKWFFFSWFHLFDIWFVRDWAYCFLHIWGFWSNNPGHGFKKLTQVDIFFFCLFSFSSFAGWLAAYYLHYMSIRLSRAYLFCIFLFTFMFQRFFFQVTVMTFFHLYI